MKKHIKINRVTVEYPVGSSIENVRAIINQYRIGFRKLKYPKFTCFNLWCRGSSGAILATAFALAFPRYRFVICHVKKHGESSHSSGADSYDDAINIVIDDFISSGSTINAIRNEMRANNQNSDILLITNGASDISIRSKFEIIISGDSNM